MSDLLMYGPGVQRHVAIGTKIAAERKRHPKNCRYRKCKDRL